MIIVLAIFLAIYGLIIYGFFCTLRRIGIRDRTAIFAGFTMFGLLSGLLATLYGHHEGQGIFNIIGVPLGEEVYSYSIDHFGNPDSGHAHYTIPWILRIPQICFFTSTIIFSLIGLIIQLIYNLIWKPPSVKVINILIIVFILFACFGAFTGIIYASVK